MAGREPFRLVNSTRGVTIAECTRLADNAWTGFKGLMGVAPLPADHALLITPSSSIHTHFMRFAIDVLYVNKDDVIVGIDRDDVVTAAKQLGALSQASKLTPSLRPLLVTDHFLSEFGLGLCGIGKSATTKKLSWYLKVNHENPNKGGEKVKLHEGDEVLWALEPYPYPDELSLVAPHEAEPNKPFTVSVFSYDDKGKKAPAVGATVTGSNAVAGNLGAATNFTLGSAQQRFSLSAVGSVSFAAIPIGPPRGAGVRSAVPTQVHIRMGAGRVPAYAVTSRGSRLFSRVHAGRRSSVHSSRSGSRFSGSPWITKVSPATLRRPPARGFTTSLARSSNVAVSAWMRVSPKPTLRSHRPVPLRS